MDFTNICCLVVEKSKLKFSLAPLKLLTNFENSNSSPLQRPYSGDFGPENAYGSHL